MVSRSVLIAELGRAHGVRGLLRYRSFGEREITAYNPLHDAAGRAFVLRPHGADLVAVDGIADRDAAERLTGTKLFVPRERLPPPDEDEFYLADLVGLAAVTADGASLGRVLAVDDHGAGAFLTLSGPPERLVPFTRACVPVVDVAGGRVVVEPPAETEAKPE
jgi:16S rRNA processing protein RimM